MPSYWLNDTRNNRWIGYGSLLFTDQIAIDKTTKEITELPHHLEDDWTYAISADGSAVYSAQMSTSQEGGKGGLSIFSTDLATGNVIYLFHINLEDASPQIYRGPLFTTAFDSKNNDYYAMVKKFNSEESTFPYESIIVRVNVITGVHSVVTNTAKSGLSFLNITSLLFSGDSLYILTQQPSTNGVQDTVYTVDLTTGKLTKVTDGFNIIGARMAIDEEKHHLYVVGYRDIAKVDLSDGSFQLISDDIKQSPYNFNQVEQAYFDQDKLLVIGTGEIISVNLLTGARSYYLPTGIGTGLKLISARQLVVNSDHTIAYVLDDAGNAPERLIKIDLTNGARTQLYQWNLSRHASSLILDEENQQLFFQFEELVGKFNLVTNQVTEFYKFPYTSDGKFYIGNIALDKKNNRLLFNNNPGIISSIDLATNALNTAFNTALGDEFRIENGMSMALDTKRNKLILKGDGQGKLISLDLMTGKRELVLDSCNDDTNYNQIPQDFHTELVYDATSDSIWLNGDFEAIKVDLAAATCAYIRPRTTLSGPPLVAPLDIWPLINNTFLTVNGRSLLLVNFATGNSTIISR